MPSTAFWSQTAATEGLRFNGGVVGRSSSDASFETLSRTSLRDRGASWPLSCLRLVPVPRRRAGSGCCQGAVRMRVRDGAGADTLCGVQCRVQGG
jgi:hypothetical protein